MGAEMNVMSCYESIAEASARMVAAARCSDWDGLIAAEKDCARHIRLLQAIDTLDSLGPTADQRRHDIIRTVLAHDAEIRDLTQPWMARLEQLLNAAAQGRRMEQAYR